jgi:hypothetical protein
MLTLLLVSIISLRAEIALTAPGLATLHLDLGDACIPVKHMLHAAVVTTTIDQQRARQPRWQLPCYCCLSLLDLNEQESAVS